MAPELSVADARIKWTTYLVIIILATLLAAWWWNKEQNDDVPITLDTQSSGSEQPAATDTDSASSKIEAVSENLIESNAAETAETANSQTPAATEVTGVAESESADAVVVQEPVAEEVVREPAAEEVVQEPAAEEVVQEPAAEEVVQEPTAEESEVEAAEVMAPETVGVVDTGPTRIAPAGTDKMQLIVNAATWADIKDSSGYQLVYDLLRADETVDLMGQAPFTVFLGNGHGVEINFNGGEIDFSRRIRDDNTARLKIGG